MRTPHLALALGTALVFALPSAPPAAAGPAGAADYEALATAFKKELADEKPAARLRAFQMASASTDPRVVDLLIDGVDQEGARKEGIAKAQAETEAALEAVLSEIEKANAAVPQTSREIEAFNKKMKKFETKRDAAYAKLRDLASDVAQESAIIGSGVSGIVKVLRALPPATAVAAFPPIAARWFAEKSSTEARVRYLDVVAGVNVPEAQKILRDVANDATADPRVRVVAIGNVVARAEAGAVEAILPLLTSTTWPVVAATIGGLRRLHRREAIEPLIAFLDRGEEIGRLRTDAHVALRSLTGQSHGPYAQPWRDWWATAKDKLVMPAKPTDEDGIAQPDNGTTFFGITTFSYHILYVLDVSGSMIDIAHADAGGARGKERKIDAARRELLGSLDSLDEKKTFNMVFFGHKVIRYMGGTVEADKTSRERAKRFAAELEPAGGTNIHDALETAFRLAGTASDGKTYQPVFDTIFFMTDGTPTAGKLQKPAEILAAVAEWNRTAKITIHVVGVGDACDEKFLMDLASSNGGIYVHR